MRKVKIITVLLFITVEMLSQSMDSKLYVVLRNTDAYEKPKYGSILGPIHKFDTIRVIGSSKKFYKFKYMVIGGELDGYASKKVCIPWDDYLVQYELPMNNISQSKLEEMKSLFGDTNGWKVYKGLYWVGMTEKMLIYSIGQPDWKYTKIGLWGSQKVYIYNRTDEDRTFLIKLYFQNDVMTHFQIIKDTDWGLVF